jgi:hypothetical protein
MEQRICQWCKNQFNINSYEIKKGGGKYCSNKCQGLAERKRIKKLCPVCGIEFETIPSEILNNKGKYCSKMCYYQDKKNKIGKLSPSWRGGKDLRLCKLCGKEFKVFPSYKSIYCSKDCNNISKKIIRDEIKYKLNARIHSLFCNV